MKTRESGRPVTVGEAIMALRKFAQKSWDYEELILNWAADWMEKASKNEPLTIEELRKMNEQPVWCESMGCWGIVTVEESGRWAGIPFLLGRQGCRFELDIESRGLVVYRMKPVEGGAENESAC